MFSRASEVYLNIVSILAETIWLNVTFASCWRTMVRARLLQLSAMLSISLTMLSIDEIRILPS